MKTTPWISALLQVEDGTEVLVQEAKGLDSQGAPSLCRAWLHPRVEKEKGLTQEDLDGYWLPDVLAIKGVPAAEGEDVVEASMPTPNIKQVLAIPDGVPVLQLYRVMKQDDLVVAVIETHLPADQTTLVFPRIPLHF